MDPLRFGPLDAPDTRRVLPGVVAGIGGYGNCLGLPNIGLAMIPGHPAVQDDASFRRHLLETTLPMVIIDPNSDHVHLGKLRSTADLNRGRERPLSKRDEAALRRRHADAGRVVVARRGTGADMPLQIHLSDLTIAEQALTLGLDPIADSDEFSAFIDAIHSLGDVRYGIAAVEAVLRARAGEGKLAAGAKAANEKVGV
jgi:hypothetical protein